MKKGRVLTTRIEVRKLSKYFKDIPAVQDVDLCIRAGEIYGLVGPDGAGKTTTIRLLCGAIRPTTGEVWIGGVDMLRHPESARQRIGYLAQRFALYDELTVMENLRFFAEVRGLSASQWRPRCMETLDFVGLEPYTDRLAGQLSGGMKQKLGLAVAMVHQPEILLLDEPTTGVDPVTRQDFWQLIIQLVTHQEVAVLVSTPYMDEAARCMRIGFLRHGRLLVEGTPTALRSRLKGCVLELRGGNLLAFRRIAEKEKHVEDVQLFGDRAHLRVRSGKRKRVQERLEKYFKEQGLEGFSLEPVEPQLEDVFISLQQMKEASFGLCGKGDLLK